jgi:hypothetical protein
MYSGILQAQVLSPLKVTSKGDISSHGGVTQFRHPTTKTLTDTRHLKKLGVMCMLLCEQGFHSYGTYATQGNPKSDG